MKILEIVLRHERMDKKVEYLKKIFPDLTVVARSEFYYIYSCQIEELTVEVKK